MVGIPRNRDYEDLILDDMRENPFDSIAKRALHLKMQPNKVIETLRTLTAKGLVTKHEDKTYPYYTINSNPIENYMEFVKGSLEYYHKLMEQYMKKLGRKPIFKNIKRKGFSVSYKIREKPKADYDNILQLISGIIGLVGVLPFAQSLGLISDKPSYDRKVKQLQKQEYEYLTKIISKLSRERKTESDVIERDIEFRIPIFEQLRYLPTIAKPWA